MKRRRFTLAVSTFWIIVILLCAAAAALVLIAIFKSGPIHRFGIVGVTETSIDGTAWTAYPSAISSSIVDPLYFRFRTTDVGYSGTVVVTWKLVDSGSGAEIQVLPDYTTVDLTGSAGQEIYATVNGTGAPGPDWGSIANYPGDFYVQVEFYK